MKQILLMIAVVALVGCGKKEPVQKEPKLRSENIITPDEAANELFVEAVVLVNEAKAQEVSDVEVAIKKYEEAFAKLQKIISDYKKSALAVKLISGETLFDGESLEQLRKRPLQLLRGVAEAKAKLIAEKAELEKSKIKSDLVEGAIRERLKLIGESPKDELTKADLAKVTRLDLEDAKITDAGLKDVAKLQQLEMLYLINTKITDAGLRDIAKLQKLTSLDLGFNKITDAGLKELTKMQNLKRLYLDLNEITDAGLKNIAKLQNLTDLALNGTQITDAGLKDVAKLQQLEMLYLINTKITDAGAAELKKALPGCLISHSHKKD